jgi:hypothetical protein
MLLRESESMIKDRPKAMIIDFIQAYQAHPPRQIEDKSCAEP